MEKELTKLFGFIMSSITFILFIINIIISFNINGIIFFDLVQYILISSSIVMLFSSFCTVGKYIQLFYIFLLSIITIIFLSNFGLGMVQCLIIILLMDKYGFFKRHMVLKISILTVLYLISIIISQQLLGLSFIENHNIYAYFILIISIVILIKFEEIKITFYKEKGYKEEIKKLHESLLVSRMKFDLLNTSYIDPLQAGLTKAEVELLKKLCLYKESNADLALRLNKSVNTVKVQMKNISIKIGADSRHQLIDLCQNYFVEKEIQTIAVK